MKTLLLPLFLLLSSLASAQSLDCFFVTVCDTGMFPPFTIDCHQEFHCRYVPAPPNLPGGPSCPPDCYPFCPLPQPDLGPQTSVTPPSEGTCPILTPDVAEPVCTPTSRRPFILTPAIGL